MQVHDLVMAAMLAAEPELHSAARMHVPHRTNCFEVTTAFCMAHINTQVTLQAACHRLHACRAVMGSINKVR